MADIDPAFEQQVLDLSKQKRIFIITAQRIKPGELLK